MTNRLTKHTLMSYTPGSPGVPYSPGQPYIAPYTSYEPRLVCGWSATNGSYQWVYDQVSQQYQYLLIPDPGSAASSASWVCQTQQVPVQNPGQPFIPPSGGAPYVPAQINYDYNLGWNSGARSKNAFAGDGYVQFQVSPSLIGAVAGLNETDPDADYLNIDHAFYVSNGIVRILESGIEKGYLGPIPSAATLRITRRQGTVRYYINNTLQYTSLKPSLGTVFLDASLYSGGDYVENPALNSFTSADPVFESMTMSGGNARAGWSSMTFELIRGSASTGLGRQSTLSFEPMQMSAGKWMAGLTGTHASASMVMRPMTMSTRWAEGASLAMQPLTAYGGSGAQAAAHLSFLPMTVESRHGGFVPSIAVANLSFPQMTSSGLVLTGGVANGSLTLPMPTLLAGRAGYGEASLSLAALTMYGSAFEGNTNASMRELVLANQTLEYFGYVDVRFDTGILADMSLDALVLKDAFYVETADATTTLIPNATLNALLQVELQMYAGIPVFTEAGEVWVVNDESGASSQYENYSFNSYARYQGKYLGAKADGVYLLEGAADASTPIRSSISLGTKDFGTTLAKSITNCFIGVSSTGDVYLRVTAGGASYTYKTVANTSYIDTQRIQIGQGLRANYITFELFNENGADFELATVEFEAAVLTRRI